MEGRFVRVWLIITTVFTVGLFVPATGVAANVTGTWISAPIGTDHLTSFTKLTVVGQSLPAGSAITYSLSGQQSSYQDWSTPAALAADGTLDLTSIAQISQSKYLKLRIALTGDSTNSPTLKSFTVGYLTTDATSSITTTPSAPVMQPTPTAQTDTSTDVAATAAPVKSAKDQMNDATSLVQLNQLRTQALADAKAQALSDYTAAKAKDAGNKKALSRDKKNYQKALAAQQAAVTKIYTAKKKALAKKKK